jgi:hypothetical protein
MTFNWTNGPELSILLHREHGRDYAAEVLPKEDGAQYFSWCLYCDSRVMAWGWDYDRDTAKSEAETALAALIAADTP